MSLLIMENIEKEYRNEEVLKGVTLRIEKGDRVALIGPNGAGKTTLIKIAMGIEKEDRGEIIFARNIKTAYLSQDMEELKDDNESPLKYNKILNMEEKIRLLENSMENLDASSKEYSRVMNKYLRLINEFEAMDGYMLESKIKKILLGLGIRKGSLDTPTKFLSGGEKMRVALARILLQEPDLIILDEPTNHLDLSGIEWLEDFLKKFTGGVIFICHDRYFLDNVATRIVELRGGTLVEGKCNYSSFVTQKMIQEEYIRKESKNLSIRIREERKIMESLKSKGKIKTAKSREKIMENKYKEEVEKLKKDKSNYHIEKNKLSLQFTNANKLSKDIARGEYINKSFDEIEIIKNGSFHIRGGEKVGLIGANGSGKTTLIKMLLGQDTNYSGKLILGTWVKYGYLSQEMSFSNEDNSVIEEILNKKDFTKDEALKYLARYNFYGEQCNKKISILSGGEKVRLYLSKLILDNPSCLILDEPTNHLDIEGREAMENAILSFKGTVISISHDRYFLSNCVNKIIEITEDKSLKTYNGNFEYYKNIKSKGEIVDLYNNKKLNKNKEKDREPKKEREDNKKSNESIEFEIINLEDKARKMEEGFDGNTSKDIYLEYKCLIDKIEGLYDKLYEDCAT